MQINILPYLVFPMIVISIGLLIIVYYSRRKLETDFEKENKELGNYRFLENLTKKVSLI
jgi:hypothetical protein